MKSVALDLGDHSYTIRVANGARHRLPEIVETFSRDVLCVVISQRAILDAYPEYLEELKASGLRVELIVIPGDESAKSIEVATRVWSEMVTLGCDRSSLIIALGGGVVGDLSGFVASTYMRGIRYIQVPTTLLAMIDSAIGGKTAVNLPAGKNLVGAIYQPAAVVVDPEFLVTLQRRNVVSSLAEAVKYGFIRDRAIFDLIEQNLDALIALENESALAEIIFKSCAIKAEIVSNDPFEHGERKLLNYGHTIGHAFETLGQYSGVYHGEAVIYGMQCANHISFRKGFLDETSYERAQRLLTRFGLPPLAGIEPEKVLSVVAHDKKVINGTLNFILIDQIGNAFVSTDVTPNEIEESLGVVCAQ